MRDPARITQIMAALQSIWEANPDLRFGQLLLNINPSYETLLWFTEDTDLVRSISQWTERPKKN